MLQGKGKRAAYTLEHKVDSGRESLLSDGQSVGYSKQTPANWGRLAAKGKLAGAVFKPVSAEKMEFAQVKAQLARVKMEHDTLKKRQARSVVYGLRQIP